MDTKKMRACAPLLPAPGDEVVIQCLNEIERLRALVIDYAVVCGELSKGLESDDPIFAELVALGKRIDA